MAGQLIVHDAALPATVEDLAKFALIGREKLVAVRAEIRAIDKVGLAQDVRQQKLKEAQEISEAVLDAEVRIGELMRDVPKAQGKRTDTQPTDSAVGKYDVIREAGFTPKQVERFETLAAHPEIVEQAKAEARENDDIVSRSLVLNMVQEKKRADREAQREEERQENAVKIETLKTPLEAKGLFQTIVIDPPWDWGCRCIVVAIDEEDVKELGLEVTPNGGHMPNPQRSESFTFDASDASGDLDMLVNNRDDADCRAFVNMARNYTVNRDDGSECTMWDHMLEHKMKKTANALTALTERDGKERAVVRDFTTGKPIGDVIKGDANSVKPEIPEDVTICTLHTHPNGDNTPSPADLKFGWETGSKAEFIAAGKQLRRWQWLKTPTPEDADLLKAFALAIDDGDFNRYAYDDFIARLIREGFIKMENL